MRVAFLQNGHRREQLLCAAFRHGLIAHGDRLTAVPYDDQARDLGVDAIAFVGVKCLEWHDFCVATHTPFIYLDKGYFYPKERYASAQARIVNCWRIAINTNQPLEYLASASHSSKRWDAFGPHPKPWRIAGRHIIIAGSSPKFHLFHHISPPTEWAENVVAELRKHTDRPIHYRPKPAWWIRSPEEAVPIDDTDFIPTESFEDRLEGAHAVVTYGSNAALIGMLSGVPAIVLGNGVMRAISSTSLADIETPYLAPEPDRLQLLYNLAWSQFTLAEISRGLAWSTLKPLLAKGGK